jgi:micrococcal nuclease
MAAMKAVQPFHSAVMRVRAQTRRPNLALALALVMSMPFAAPSAAADGLPACLPPVAIARAQIARTDAAGVLFLRDGRAVKVEGLLRPAEGGAFHQFQTTWKRLLDGLTVSLRARAPKLDRYGRLRAQVLLSDDRWLQEELLRRGLARAEIAPDRPECARELYAAEEEARKAHLGLWAVPGNAIRTPESLRWRDLGTFQIVEGTVLNVKVSGRAYLNFGRNWRTDFTVTISTDAMKTFRRAGVDPYGYVGKRIRVRGYIDRMNGFEIEAASPEAIEMLPSRSAP